jgi:spore coat protein CotF
MKKERRLFMEEKTMVNDVLDNTKAELTTYQGVISEAENMQLRQTIQQIRNNCESFQYELFKVAMSKGYYKPAEQATTTQIQTVKNELQ